ncbi:hypothetical protein AGRO_3698 [Agrobacterium sp. ATCC 31749]|nr:hypothetical protein AGRO_3698 [Agrobacterium sp. ATCC 31749]
MGGLKAEPVDLNIRRIRLTGAAAFLVSNQFHFGIRSFGLGFGGFNRARPNTIYVPFQKQFFGAQLVVCHT